MLAIADRRKTILTVELMMHQALSINSHKESTRIRTHTLISRMEYFSSPIVWVRGMKKNEGRSVFSIKNICYLCSIVYKFQHTEGMRNLKK